MASCSDVSSVLRGDLLPIGKHDMIIESSEKFIPQTKRTIGYIVSAVLINEDGKILMVQEAKASCRGQW